MKTELEAQSNTIPSSDKQTNVYERPKSDIEGFNKGTHSDIHKRLGVYKTDILIDNGYLCNSSYRSRTVDALYPSLYVRDRLPENHTVLTTMLHTERWKEIQNEPNKSTKSTPKKGEENNTITSLIEQTGDIYLVYGENNHPHIQN